MNMCIVGNCDRLAWVKGMCSAHYNRKRNNRSKNPDAPVRIHKRQGTICKIDDCQTAPIAGGYCSTHYHEQRRKNPDNVKVERAYRFKKMYGISMQEREELLKKADFKCEICKIPLVSEETAQTKNTCHVDHDHITKKVRGVLCPNCNRGLGMFKDNLITLAAAMTYLKKHTSNNE